MRSATHCSRDTETSIGGAHLDRGQLSDETLSPLAPANLDDGQSSFGSQSRSAVVNTSPAAKKEPVSRLGAPLADFSLSRNPLASRHGSAEGELPPGHTGPEPQWSYAGGDLPADQREYDDRNVTVDGNPHDALLLILADSLDDLERARIATDNRLRSLSQVKGLGDSREANTMRHVSETLAALEHRATLDLQRAMRAHPLGPWVKRTVGVGEKQAARLLAAIGDPTTREMPSQLWQYCGHGAPSKRARGVKTFWNPTAKMRLHLIAESCMKQRTSPYRTVYDDARMDWAERDTSDGHKHNHALRMVGKAVLLDLWREAKALDA